MTDLKSLLEETGMSSAELARRIGCSRSYLSHVRAGRKAIGVPLAIRIWRITKRKVGPITNTSDADIRALTRFHDAA